MTWQRLIDTYSVLPRRDTSPVLTRDQPTSLYHEIVLAYVRSPFCVYISKQIYQ